MGEVIFVIKLAVTVGHKSWVLVLKKMAKHASVTMHCPPLKYFDFTTNLPLTGRKEIHTGTRDPSAPAAVLLERPPGVIS